MTLQGMMSLLEGPRLVRDERGRSRARRRRRPDAPDAREASQVLQRRAHASRRRSASSRRSASTTPASGSSERRSRLGGHGRRSTCVWARPEQPADASTRSPTPPRGSRGWWSSRPDAPPPGRRPRPRAGHDHGPRARACSSRATRVLVCVSGGPDSVCLLESLVRLRRLFRIRLEVFHFDHRLRAGLGGRRRVRAAARRAARVAVPSPRRRTTPPAKGESVEAWATAAHGARRCRRCAARVRAPGRGRGAHAGRPGRDGAAEPASSAPGSMGWPASGRDAAPVASSRCSTSRARRSRRSAARSACVHGTIPTNEDRRFLRNAIRLEAIPMLERGDRSRGSTPRSRGPRPCSTRIASSCCDGRAEERTGDRRAPRGRGALRRPIARGAPALARRPRRPLGALAARRGRRRGGAMDPGRGARRARPRGRTAGAAPGPARRATARRDRAYVRVASFPLSETRVSARWDAG